VLRFIDIGARFLAALESFCHVKNRAMMEAYRATILVERIKKIWI